MKVSEKTIRKIIIFIMIEFGIPNTEEDRIIQYCKNAGIVQRSFSEWWYNLKEKIGS